MNIRKQVQLEYEEKNKGKCFVKDCNNKIYKTRPLLDIEPAFIAVCKKHEKANKVPMDIRKFLAFGFK